MTNQNRPNTGDDDQVRDDEARARTQQQQPAGGMRDFETDRAPEPGEDVQTTPVIINR